MIETTTAGLTIGKTGEWFRRCVYIEKSCVRALAGWFLTMPKWEMKASIGHQLFAHAERVYALEGRLDELRGGHRDANLEPALEKFGEELVHAPDGYSFLCGLHLALEQLADTYRSFAELASPVANAPDLRFIERFIADLEREKATCAALADECRPDAGAAALENNEWRQYLDGLYRASGGMKRTSSEPEAVRSRPHTRRFDWPAPLLFDERIGPGDLGSYESKLEQTLEQRRIGEFQVYFNEYYAAAIIASVIYDCWRISAPRQFFYDIARHFWDEVRHAQFGAVRLRELGVEPAIVNTLIYDKAKEMPFLHRYCYLTLGQEVFFMPRKSVRAKYYEEQGDSRSLLFADVDWSEEINHVRYGKKWVNHFLENDARSVEDLQSEINAYLGDLDGQLPAGKKAPW